MEDFLHLDQQLTAEEKLTRQTVQDCVNEQVLPIIQQAYEKAEYPQHLTKVLGDLGLFGMTLPESVGGLGASPVSYGLACQELEKGDSALRSLVSVQNSLCMYPIFAFGTPEQHARFLPKMKTGEWLGCFGLTEPDSGSDPGSMQTKAERVTGGWRLNGHKMWITNATLAQVAIIWAKTADGVRGFLVEKDFPGVSTREITHKLALRASCTGEIMLDNCFVPDANFLPGSEVGLSAALRCLTQARYGIAWGALGAAMACYDSALAYTQARHQFGKPLAAFQLVQKDLVEMLTEIIKGQTFNLQLGRLKAQDQAHYAMISMAKMNACKTALEIARSARNLLGANGISLEYPVIRHMNNLEAVFTYEGTDNIHHLIVGRYITGCEALI